METLSTQLQTLSEKAKNTEEVVTAARERDRAALQAHRDQLRDSWDSEVSRAAQTVEPEDAALQFQWSQMRERVKGQFAELQNRSEQRHTDRDARRAERYADRAERDAAEAINFAVLAVDGAMAAVVDAALARADADDAVANSDR